MRRFLLTNVLLMIVGGLCRAEERTLANTKTFTYCAEASPVAFNAQVATDGATFNASSRAIYNRLVGIEGRTTKIIPSLAKSWSVSPDGLNITFKLREKVLFQTTDYFTPTRYFNADDVLFSINRMRDVNHPFHKVGGGHYPNYEAQQMGEVIEKIVKVDDLTILFRLRRPEAPFLANLAMDFASILSAEYGEKLLREKKTENMDQLPVGTGPFTYVWYEKNKSIRYKANPNYFEGRPFIEQLVFLIVPDPEQRLIKTQNNECQLMPNPPPEKLAEIKKDRRFKVLQQPGLNVAYLSMSVDKPPFDNVKVRRAIHHALNREKYVRAVYGGHAQVAKNPIPPTLWSYNRRTSDYDYNVGRAKSLLSEANRASGFVTDLWYADTTRPYNPNPKLMAELIRDDLAALGIQVKLHALPWQEYLKRSRAGEFPMSLQGWSGDNGDPDNFLNNLLSCQAITSGNNRARWCNKRFSFLVDRARVTTDIRKRTKFYEEAQEVFKEDVPWVTLAHSIVFQVVRQDVQGYKLNPFDVVELKDVRVK